jgi:hypothetical protein
MNIKRDNAKKAGWVAPRKGGYSAVSKSNGTSGVQDKTGTAAARRPPPPPGPAAASPAT